MASSSSSALSIHKSFEYDVFLSFRGEDTRKTFVDHLYDAFERNSIHAYKDDERIEKGKKIDEELLNSIEDSKIFIIVFSQNYASSSWCLGELVKIMECQKSVEQSAYPVFYDVEPSEVRKQSGAFAEALSVHKMEEDILKWREALYEAANLAGWELKNTANGYEAKVIKIMVEQILLELRSIHFSDDENLIGMHHRVQDVESSLQIDLNDNVRMIGIKGMGGGGKTTLARSIVNKLCWNVRENSKLHGLQSLQKQVISDILQDQGITLHSVHDGKKSIRMRLRRKKVLMVLDDVDNISQLEALAGSPNWFKPGSRIIITTRDEQLLVAHRVKWIHNINLLTDVEAVSLFSRYAFGTDLLSQGYEKLSLEVVHYASGLPLTIKVLGSFLCGKDELEWRDALKRLQKIPLKETLEKLELSYIGLEEEYKEIFLDVACILKGTLKEYAIKILESCGFYARNGLRVLEQRSLISISELCLDMLDHIQEMGRNIVRRLHPDEPNKHSRLWIHEEIKDVLANDLGTEATKYMSITTDVLPPEIVMRGLGNMKELRALHLFVDDSWYDSAYNCFPSSWKFDQVSNYFPNALRYLCWHAYPCEYLPETFIGNNLVVLDMSFGRMIQLWERGEQKVLKAKGSGGNFFSCQNMPHRCHIGKC